MSITTIGNHLIHYEVLGRGEPVIYLHGWLGSWRYWWPSMQQLSSQHRTYAFDLWGFGDSSKVQEKYFFEAYVEMLDQFVERLAIASPHIVVGHALGAAIGLRYALLRPDNVSHLAMVALPVQGEYINERLASSESDAIARRVLGKSSSYPEVESEIHKTDVAAMSTLASQLGGYDFVPDLEECGCPTLLIFGAHDPVVRQPLDSTLGAANSGIPRHVISLDGSNHFPMLEQTATFNRLLLDFFHSDGNSAIVPKERWQRRTR